MTGKLVAASMAAAMSILAGSSLPSSAQRGCVALYNETNSVREAYGPYSPQYAEIVNRYNARCGRSAAPAGRGGQCEELRLACENRERLGERGEGNCQRYRQLCQPQPSRRQVCEELRVACLHKDQLGEQGEGNCRKYRETCR